MSQSLECIYDKYGSVMYGVAMQISSNKIEAERILIHAFKKIKRQKLSDQAPPLPILKFVKLTIEAAFELYPKYKGNLLQLKLFDRSPILRKLLCDDVNIKTLSEHDEMTPAQCMKNLKMELSLFPGIKKRYLIKAITIPV